MIKSFTDVASSLTGIDRAAFVVYLRDSTPEDMGIGGELWEDCLHTKGAVTIAGGQEPLAAEGTGRKRKENEKNEQCYEDVRDH